MTEFANEKELNDSHMRTLTPSTCSSERTRSTAIALGGHVIRITVGAFILVLRRRVGLRILAQMSKRQLLRMLKDIHALLATSYLHCVGENEAREASECVQCMAAFVKNQSIRHLSAKVLSILFIQTPAQ